MIFVIYLQKIEIQYVKLKLKVKNKMAEISKQFKIVLYINFIIALIYGFFFLVIPEIYEQLADAPYSNPPLLRLWGATIIILGLFALIAAQRAEFENIKIVIELAILWLLAVGILNLAALAYVPMSPTNLASSIVDAIVPLVLFIVDLYFYRQEQKK